MDLKINPKIHVLSVLDKKFWLSNTKYQKPSVSRQFQCKKMKYFLSYPDILVPYYSIVKSSGYFRLYVTSR